MAVLYTTWRQRYKNSTFELRGSAVGAEKGCTDP